MGGWVEVEDMIVVVWLYEVILKMDGYAYPMLLLLQAKDK